ncbi:hypothetical protein RWE15_09460 [Virgibacillus halophilus]|uniref:Uncharacterized protein n=1 Tax=Tigheibacillus halophilus TaxID=361280 RepID=A0ABU5C5Q9_9BACI|nr:hypothetical protein [Virgibacillus halophilus]
MKSRPIPATVPTIVIGAIKDIFEVYVIIASEIGEIGLAKSNPVKTTNTTAGIFKGIIRPIAIPMKAIADKIKTPGMESETDMLF